MGNFTFEEMNLMCIYNTGSRTGLINSLREMRGELSPEETELRELTDSALTKLCAMTDEDFAQLELSPESSTRAIPLEPRLTYRPIFSFHKSYSAQAVASGRWA